jgi:hypothetical protein
MVNGAWFDLVGFGKFFGTAVGFYFYSGWGLKLV